MGRQAYLASLALGRSAHEPPAEDVSAEPQAHQPESSRHHGTLAQQYDARGHPSNPTARARTRALTKAMNDVLATCGMLRQAQRQAQVLPDTAAYFQTGKKDVDIVAWENQIGLLCGPIDLDVLYVATWWLQGIRIRSQTFNIFGDSSIVDMVRLQRRHHGTFSVLFAGMPANLLYVLLNLGKDYLLVSLHNLAHKFISDHEPKPKRRRQKLQFLRNVFRTLDLGAFVVLAPVQIFSALQILNLVPAYPLFPSVRAMIPFSQSSPIQSPVLPSSWTTATVALLLYHAACSPLVQLGAFARLRTTSQSGAYFLACDLFPKPENPDILSVQAALEDELGVENVPGIEPSDSRETNVVVDWFRRMIQGFDQVQSRTVQFLGLGHGSDLLPSRASRRRLRAPTQVGDPSSRFNPRELPTERAISEREQLAWGGRNPEHLTSEAALGLATDEVEAGFLEDFDGAGARQAGSHPRRTGQTLASGVIRRRVTTLSSAPTVSAATHFSQYISTWLLVPLESVLLRTIALGFLAAAKSPENQANANNLIAYMFSPMAGSEEVNNAMRPGAYLARLGACAAAEMAISFGLFELGYHGVLWLGKREFGWGQF